MDIYENYDTEQFKNDLKEIGIVLNEKQVYQFVKYYEILMEWNSFMNLTAITDPDEVFKKHFVDSLSIVKAYDFLNELKKEKSQCMIDVGTGAGFPGIPIKIVFPDVKITLLDSLNKRIKFLNEVIEKLDLKDIDAVHGRAEDYAKQGQLREKYNLSVSRAVANLSTLSEYCIPFVKLGGKFISYKSEKLMEELSSAKEAVTVLGGKVAGQVDYMLPGSDIYRNLLIIDKIKATPKKFPRKAGLPSKEPI